MREGPAAFRVMRPVEPLRGRIVSSRASWFGGTVDKHALRTLALAWAFAARSPGTITYLPFDTEAADSEVAVLDLVLIHHALQFKPSRWKRIRGRLGPGRIETIALPESAYRGGKNPAPSHYRENRDRVASVVAANTLVLTGSRVAFERDLANLRDIVENGPAEKAEHPERHLCIDLAERLIHLEYIGR